MSGAWPKTQQEFDKMIFELNRSGPYVVPDSHRGYGLMANQYYLPGEAVTLMGGVPTCNTEGKYVFYLEEEGYFKNVAVESSPECKARFINEWDATGTGTHANVILGEIVRATRLIRPGEYFYANYGKHYNRENYESPKEGKFYQSVGIFSCTGYQIPGSIKLCGEDNGWCTIWKAKVCNGWRELRGTRGCTDCLLEQNSHYCGFPIFKRNRNKANYDDKNASYSMLLATSLF